MEKVADTLSALFLLLAVVLAGGVGPLSGQPSGAVAPRSTALDDGAIRHRSVPFVSKQELFASETKGSRDAPGGDGKPAPIAGAGAPELPLPSASPSGLPSANDIAIGATASAFNARAPPAIS